MKIKGIIVDLDGTLCNSDHRKHFVDAGNWKSFYENLIHDEPHEWCLEIIKAVKWDFIFVSGRPEKYRNLTEQWFENKTDINIGFYDLFMRKDGDFRKDSIIKEEIYRGYIEPKYEIMFCIDDRKQVVDMWRSIGLTCLQCAEGNF
jgi:hypothetical protein